MDAYFSRIVPLIGDGLRQYHVNFYGEQSTQVAELLMGCRLGSMGGELNALAELVAWKAAPETPAIRQLPGLCVETRDDVHASIEWARDGSPHDTVRLSAPRGARFAWREVVNMAARQVRDHLLGRVVPPSGRVSLSCDHWPFGEGSGVARAEHAVRRKRVLLIGAGSLGSVIVQRLPELQWTVMDPAPIKIGNPLRQWYRFSDVGKSKAQVLAHQSGGTYTDEPHFADYDLVVLATGTHHHLAWADALWSQGIPHVAVCCYPQARYFETVLVLPGRTPCLACYRGHLSLAPKPTLAPPDEVNELLYSTADDRQRSALFTDLVAEPATIIETSRAADVTARLIAEVDSDWVERMLREGTTCLLGANSVETVHGEWAYGIERAGKVVRLGLSDLAAHAIGDHCGVCKRAHENSPRGATPGRDWQQSTERSFA